MISQNVLEIEQSIRRLSLEEQQWLLARISQQVQQRTDAGTADAGTQFADASYMEAQIRQMANDPDIQTELAAIEREFAVTELDGLEEL